MLRPVKNRDGPIAGIPHTGGGGSRQLGPDDNDPVSATQIPAPPNHTIFLPPQTSPSSSSITFPMILTAGATPFKYLYSPPSSTLSPPLTPCQDSPPSESDDLCSACRGSGEFVCCDTCPRVFHFLCCDPPRIDAPRGSFFCYVCAKPAEDLPIDTPLRPLFQALDHINTRAFALPTYIQNHFEDIAARHDGSFHEDVKKFPL